MEIVHRLGYLKYIAGLLHGKTFETSRYQCLGSPLRVLSSSCGVCNLRLWPHLQRLLLWLSWCHWESCVWHVLCSWNNNLLQQISQQFQLCWSRCLVSIVFAKSSSAECFCSSSEAGLLYSSSSSLPWTGQCTQWIVSWGRNLLLVSWMCFSTEISGQKTVSFRPTLNKT